MSIEEHLATAIALRAAGLSRTAQDVWKIMDQHADANGKACIAFKRLVTLVGGKRAAWQALEELQRAGLIRRVRRGSRGVGPAVFTVDAPTNRGS